ncbi:uncharacterized protein LOC130760265 [Actinidia eriantha]|uniref:uncharacterized protein LOC130760265 n=1 Tax=Actinidia eriantha TaxID=165200 RepID=UPI0025863F5A|nr:uncharacterized protein LOC130760265 [Actinidia eriantha]
MRTPLPANCGKPKPKHHSTPTTTLCIAAAAIPLPCPSLIVKIERERLSTTYGRRRSPLVVKMAHDRISSPFAARQRPMVHVAERPMFGDRLTPFAAICSPLAVHVSCSSLAARNRHIPLRSIPNCLLHHINPRLHELIKAKRTEKEKKTKPTGWEMISAQIAEHGFHLFFQVS